MITAGIDCGAKNTKTVIIKDREIIGKGTVQTGFDQKKAVEESLAEAIAAAGISSVASQVGAVLVIRTTRMGRPR